MIGKMNKSIVVAGTALMAAAEKAAAAGHVGAMYWLGEIHDGEADFPARAIAPHWAICETEAVACRWRR